MRRLLLIPLLASAAVLAHADDARAPDAPRPVMAPHWGDVLFQFYQGRYFPSTTTLMVSQQFQRLPSHDDEAEVLRGGLLLSYGVHDEAEAIFQRLIERGTSAAVRDRAWFFLAKLRYQRGLTAAAEQALQRVGTALTPDLEDERVLLLARLQMARGDHAAAAATLAPLAQRPLEKKQPEAIAPLYARYNQGIALIEQGDLAGGSALLVTLGQLAAPFEEQRALRDKANLALGFAALRAEKPEDARRHLERVRLAGLQSNKALLGFGWAAAALKKHEDALVPWTELLQRDPTDTAVLEARIAVPYAYAELGATGQAMQRYTDAVALFERESAALDESISAVRGGRLVAALMERNPGEEMGWLSQLQALPELPHPGQLMPVVARHDFQEAFKSYRDLQFLIANLREWADKLVVYDDMLVNRRQAYAERLPRFQRAASQVEVTPLAQRADALAAELAHASQAAEAGDGRGFADARQLELLAMIDQARRVLAAAPADDADARELRERLRRTEGALTWTLAQDVSARRWSAEKLLRSLRAALDEAREREAALAQAPKDEPQRFEAFAQRLAALARRVAGMTPGVMALAQEQQQAVQDIAVAELQRQQQRLAEYTAQARFAMAQLQDSAMAKAGASTPGGADAPR